MDCLKPLGLGSAAFYRLLFGWPVGQMGLCDHNLDKAEPVELVSGLSPEVSSVGDCLQAHTLPLFVAYRLPGFGLKIRILEPQRWVP